MEDGDSKHMRGSMIPNKPGVYTLIIELSEALTINIGSLGVQRFHRGLYTYTGSALGRRSTTLRTRVKRHLTRGKRRRWHIDYLLNPEASEVKEVLFILTSNNLECVISKDIARLNGAEIIIKGFGSSDCRSRCGSHLHYFSEIDFDKLSREISSIYQRYGTRLVVGRAASSNV